MADRALIEQLKGQIASLESAGAPSKPRSTSKRSRQTDEGASRLRAQSAAQGSEDHTAAAALQASATGKTLDEASCLRVAIKSLAASDQPTARLSSKLATKGYPEQVVDTTIAKLNELGYLNDERFARNYVRSKLAQGKGVQGIRRDLRAMSIDPDTIPGLFEEQLESLPSEAQRAYDYLSQHPPRSKNLREGAYRKLISKGYSSSAAVTAARMWSEEQMRS